MGNVYTVSVYVGICFHHFVYFVVGIVGTSASFTTLWRTEQNRAMNHCILPLSVDSKLVSL